MRELGRPHHPRQTRDSQPKATCGAHDTANSEQLSGLGCAACARGRRGRRCCARVDRAEGPVAGMLERLSLHVRLESIPVRRRRVPYRAAWKFGTLDRSLARRLFVHMWKVFRIRAGRKQPWTVALQHLLHSSHCFSPARKHGHGLLPSVASRLPPMQILGRHSATGAMPSHFGPVVLHDDRSTNSRLELTVRQIYRDASSDWLPAATIVRFRSL